MTDVQREAYEGNAEIHSDPFGLVSRDNRNHAKKQGLILEHTTATRGDPILEVGCGHGLHATEYARRFQYTGVDLSESLAAEARERARSVSPDAEVLQMDAQRLEFDDDVFQAVVGTAILHHLEDQTGALREWLRVTKPGGSITVVEPNYRFPLAFATTHLVPEERHKKGMTPSRLAATLDGLPQGSWLVEPCLYTPPWPTAFAGLYDAVDEVLTRVPGIRWASQMVVIHGDV